MAVTSPAPVRVILLCDQSCPTDLGPAGLVESIHCISDHRSLTAPDNTVYPWFRSVLQMGLALTPWALESAFGQTPWVLVINWDAQERQQPKSSVDMVVKDWLQHLNQDVDVVTHDHDGSVLARAGITTQAYIAARKQQLIQASQAALNQGEALLALAAPALQTDPARYQLVGSMNHDPRCNERGETRQALLLTPPDQLPPRLMEVHRLHQLYLKHAGHMADAQAVLNYAPLSRQLLGRWRLIRALKRLTPPAHSNVEMRNDTRCRLEPVDWQWSPEPSFTTPSALPAPAGLNVMGYVKGEFGQGEAARSLLHACQAAGIAFSVTDMGFQTRHPQADYPVLQHADDRRFPIDLHYINAAQEGITAKFLHEQGLGRNRYTIGFWHWEQPTIPMGHWSAFPYLDEIWAPSQFVAQAVADVSPLPVFTVPHAIVCEPSEHARRRHFGLPEGRLLVLVMYDFLSYQQRKNPEAAVRAFRMASAQAPEMGLVIKTINGHQHPEALAALKASVADLPHVFFVDDFLSRQQAWDLQACCDILLSLHRAEGFGLAPAEMMRLGKAVVATGWSANMDFMSEQNSMPVRHTLKPLEHDVGPYPAGPLWAEADEAHAAWCLLQLAQQADLRQRLGQAASHSIRTQLSPQAVGERIAQRLKTLGHWHPQLLAPARAGSRP